MKRTIPVPLVLLLLGLTPNGARADAVDDFWLGRELRLERIQFSANGTPHETRGSELAKFPNTFDIHLPGWMVGVSSAQVFTGQGYRSANTIVWEFQEQVTGSDVDSVVGWIQVEPTYISASEETSCIEDEPCLGNIEFELVDSSLVATGSTPFGTWSEPITVQAFDGYGGLPQPRLTEVWGYTGMTTPDTTQYVSWWIELGSPARSGGEEIDIETTVGPGFGFTVPSAVTVQGGSTTTQVQIAVEPDFIGKVDFLFGTPGSQLRRSFSVTRKPPKRRKPWWKGIREMHPPWKFDCPECSVLIDWNPLGGLVQNMDRLVWTQHGQDFDLWEQDLLANTSVLDASAGGWLVGFEESGAPFIARALNGTVTDFRNLNGLEEGTMFEPVGVAADGTTYGNLVVESGLSHAARIGVGLTTPVLLPIDGENSQIFGVEDSGGVVGGASDGYGFAIGTSNEVAMLEPPEWADAVIPVSSSFDGTVVGSVIVEGMHQAVRVANGETHAIEGIPEGLQSWAIGTADDGSIVINATNEEESQVFVYSDELGEAVPLDALLEESGVSVHVDQALAVGERGVVVSGVDEDGTSTLYVLGS